MDEVLTSLLTLNVLDILLKLLILNLNICEHSQVIFLTHGFPFVDESLFLTINISNVGYITVSLTQLVLEHTNNLLDLVDLRVDAL